MIAGVERLVRLGDVDVWCLDLRLDEAELARRWLLLSEEERARADRFGVPDIRRRFVAARAGLREILAVVLSVAPGALHFELGPQGKPALRAGPSFNLSHAEDLAICAVAPRRAVGVDLELLRPVPEAAAIAASWFSAQEQATLREAVNEPFHRTFLRLWTRREAWLKALGVGMAGEDQARPPDEARWEILDLAPRAGYVGALVVERDRPWIAP